MIFEAVGSFAFGFVVGWITYRTLRRKEGSAALSDISTVVGAVGGGAVTALFNSRYMFGAYSIGLFVGFFLYLLVGIAIGSKKQASGWMGELR